MGGRVRGAEVIDGVHEAPPHEMGPDAVHLGFGEEGIGGIRDPVRRGFEVVLGRERLGIEFSGAQQLRLQFLPSARVGELHLLHQLHDLLTVEGVFVILVHALVLQHLVVHATKDGTPLEVVILCPAVKGVVVTLGALQPGAQKDAGDAFCPGIGSRMAR